MRVCKIDIGGDLRTGDVIGVSYGNHIAYGWFIPDGESLMFIDFRNVKNAKDQFNAYEEEVRNGNNTTAWLAKKFVKGFAFKNISRDFITSWGNQRVFKVPNPAEFFAGSTVEPLYNVSKQILQDLKFPAK